MFRCLHKKYLIHASILSGSSAVETLYGYHLLEINACTEICTWIHGKEKIEKYWEKTYTYIINEGDIYKDNIANENTQLTAHSPLLITLMNLQTFISLILFFMLISLPNLA